MWFPFALIFALTISGIFVIAKRVMKETDEYTFLFFSGLLTIPVLFLIVVYFYEIPAIDSTFLQATAVAVLFNVGAAVLAYRAIKLADISLVSPIAAFNPVFTSLMGAAILGETMGVKGSAGIGLVVLGAYILQVSASQKSLLEPIKKLVTTEGVQLSFMAYFLWAVTPAFQKIAIMHTQPQVPPFASLAGIIGSVAVFGLLANKYSRNVKRVVRKYIKLLVLAAVLGGVGQAAAFIAFSLTKVGFATAVFQTSMIFTVLLGWLLFKERDIRDRFAGAAVMLAGIYLLVT